ncbi:hypothetical protein Q31a_55300 [Aureliella helgolandensis]|uniref:Uncharacterized protein n=2 Tax=Aureliella helgolandensis TaxID=2527968 RepID=A0A518GEX6_9BACT|nr:hypothetical protein Q31a_55300 [Aureliella helgolandensis]
MYGSGGRKDPCFNFAGVLNASWLATDDRTIDRGKLLRMAAHRTNRWQVHESTARGLTRLAFLILGVLPLAFCVAWTLLHATSLYGRFRTAQWEAWLTGTLGVSVEVASWEGKSPDRFVLHGIQLKHPETKQIIARVQSADVAFYRGQWLVQLDQPNLESDQMATVWRIAHDWMLCRPSAASKAAVFRMQQVVVRSETREQTLRNVLVSFFPEFDSQWLTIDFQFTDRPEHLVGAQSHEALAQNESQQAEQIDSSRLMIRRHHGEQQLMTEMQLRTGATSLPCSLVVDLLPQLKALGDQARFAGVIDFRQWNRVWGLWINKPKSTPEANSDDEWSRFEGIDFGRLTWGSGAALNGMGNLLIKEAFLSSEGLQSIHGGLEMPTPGFISGRLLETMGRYMDVVTPVTQSMPDGGYAFRAVHCFFQISPGKIHLVGRQPDGVIVAGNQGVLATRAIEKWSQPIELSRVVAALSDSAKFVSESVVDEDSTGLRSTHREVLGWLPKLAMVWLPLETPRTDVAVEDSSLSDLR